MSPFQESLARMAFNAHWYAREHFDPHPRDSRVNEAWEWFKLGTEWGRPSSDQTETDKPTKP